MGTQVQHTSGYVCVGMTGQELDRLQIPLMVEARENEEALRTAFTVTVDVRAGTSTGISAADRCTLFQLLLPLLTQPGACADDAVGRRSTSRLRKSGDVLL